MGKTRLIGELAQRAHDDGATVLWGGCEEELAVPYRPFVDALRDWLAHVPDTAARAVLTRGEIVRLIPELTLRFPDLPEPAIGEPDFERLSLFEHVTEIVRAIASTRTRAPRRRRPALGDRADGPPVPPSRTRSPPVRS